MVLTFYPQSISDSKRKSSGWNVTGVGFNQNEYDALVEGGFIDGGKLKTLDV